MPIYEFKCSECSLKFEKMFSKISENSQEDCPNCGKLATRLISSPNFKFAESKLIPKEIDLDIGRKANQLWMDYEDRKSAKDKIRKENNSQRLSRDPDGNYLPLTVTKNDKIVSEQEAVNIRKELFKSFEDIKKDPTVERSEIADPNEAKLLKGEKLDE